MVSRSRAGPQQQAGLAAACGQRKRSTWQSPIEGLGRVETGEDGGARLREKTAAMHMRVRQADDPRMIACLSPGRTCIHRGMQAGEGED